MYKRKKRQPIVIGKLPFVKEVDVSKFHTPAIEIELFALDGQTGWGMEDWHELCPEQMINNEENATNLANYILAHFAIENIDWLLYTGEYNEKEIIQVGKKKTTIPVLLDCPELETEFTDLKMFAYGSVSRWKKFRTALAKALDKKRKIFKKKIFKIVDKGDASIVAFMKLWFSFDKEGNLILQVGATNIERKLW